MVTKLRDEEGEYTRLDFLNFLSPAESDDEEPRSTLPPHQSSLLFAMSDVDMYNPKDVSGLDDSALAVLDATACVKSGAMLDKATQYSYYLRSSFDPACLDAPVIQNIVASAHVGRDLDLRELAISTRNAEYNPRKFNALIARIREPRCTALIFRTGRVMVTGCKTVDAAHLAAKRIAKLIRREFGGPLHFAEFKVENIVASFNCNVPIRLERLYEEHKLFCNYEPEIFAGLVYRFALPDGNEAVLLIFVSGNVIITGCRSPDEIQMIHTHMFPLLQEYKQ
ncbi:TATA-box binding protein, putative [Babesia bigemina]|uniref:TATA-box binding protein, putative n=1 Tax=Babesia bigemina TaxID=5866 RepID=A0A061D7H0_BABBI|nr:TATA-box binding protein, putative [Babesia bigemina]CDR94824.1 TATA-box binding protein, putative [Babesia bigemina]|eukprot:XP_012767010.1 TATA-box binding protein, putative [Babesia bigemina]